MGILFARRGVVIMRPGIAFTATWSTITFLATYNGIAVRAFVAESFVSRGQSVSRPFIPSRNYAETLDNAQEATVSPWEKIPLETYQEILSDAEFAAREAGKIILSHVGCGAFGEDTCEIKSSIKDIVTEYDKACQDCMQSIIEERYPTHKILGEEDVEPGAAASEKALEDALSDNDEFMWILDPIDGTANFSSGMALCGVIVSVVYKDIAVVGVCYDPFADEMFSTIKGQGAFLSKKQGSVKEQMFVSSAVTDISDAIINAGCPADKNAFDTSMKAVVALNTKARGIRVIACTALTTAWIAAGRLTAHYGYDISSWDLAAGALLIQEAGGMITDIDGSKYTLKTRNMLCSNGHVHDQVLTALKEADAVTFERSS